MNCFRFLLCFLLVAEISSCTKNFESVNTNPALITEEIIRPSMLFTGVLKNSVFATYANSVFKEYSNYYSNEATGAIFQDRDWTNPYSVYLNNLINIAEVVRLTADKPSLSNQHAIARIWKVWVFQQLTDAYGDLPYSEAVLGVDGVINQPKYDTQESIYRAMFEELEEAESMLVADPAKASFGNADPIYNGDIEKWKRFANSLRLRLALRVRYADPELTEANIASVLSKPLIDDNSLNAKLVTLNDANANNRNPLYNERVATNGYPVWVGFTVTQELLKRNDPRLPLYANPAAIGAAGYRGRPLTLGNEQKARYADDSTAVLPISYQEPVYNIIVINAAEVFFLRAEAALFGLSAENAQDLYENGIQKAMEQYEVPGSAIASYLSSSEGALSGTDEEKLESIIVQKYLAMYNQGAEAWAEYRRTGYPTIWTGSDIGSTNGIIPRRLTYPQSEYALNNANVTEAAARLQGGDKMVSRIWWDAKPGLPILHPRQGMYPPEIY